MSRPIWAARFLDHGWRRILRNANGKGRAPRFNLFKTRQGFLERHRQLNYAFQSRADNGRFDEHELARRIEYASIRRFEIDLEPFLHLETAARNNRPTRTGCAWTPACVFSSSTLPIGRSTTSCAC